MLYRCECMHLSLPLIYIYIYIYIGSFFWLHLKACGILVPRWGMEPVPPAAEAWSPNRWTSRDFSGENCPGCTPQPMPPPSQVPWPPAAGSASPWTSACTLLVINWNSRVSFLHINVRGQVTSGDWGWVGLVNHSPGILKIHQEYMAVVDDRFWGGIAQLY